MGTKRGAIKERWFSSVINCMNEPDTLPERAKKAFAIVATGEMSQYANVILKKGIVTD